MFSFNHDAGKLFRAGIAEDHTTVFAECGLGFSEGAGDFGKRFKRRFGFYFYIDNGLRVVLKTFDEGFDFAVHGDERSDFYRSEKAVAGRTVLKKNDVAGLLATDDVAAAEHFFENIAIADGSAGEGDAFAGEDAFEAEIGHGSGDNTVAFELILRFEMTSDGQKNAVAIDDFPGLADEKCAIGIAIESDTEPAALRNDALPQTFEMQRSTTIIDVAAIRGDAHGDDVRAERTEEFGAKLVSGAVGAVQNNAKAGERCAGNDAAAKKIEIFGVERFVSNGEGRIFRRRIGSVLENIGFEFEFDGIREFHAGVREKLHAIVVVRIVRGGNNNASLKIVLADETGDARCGDNAREGNGCAGVFEPGSEEGSNVGAGFAGVHADKNVCGRVFAEQKGGERTAGGEKSGVVERRSARNAANAVGSEQFFGHERLTVNS